MSRPESPKGPHPLTQFNSGFVGHSIYGFERLFRRWFFLLLLQKRVHYFLAGGF